MFMLFISLILLVLLIVIIFRGALFSKKKAANLLTNQEELTLTEYERLQKNQSNVQKFKDKSEEIIAVIDSGNGDDVSVGSVSVHKIEDQYTTPDAYPICLKGWTKSKDMAIETVKRSDKGILEDFFYGFLVEIFGNELKSNFSFIIEGIRLTPDFCLFHEERDLRIVIEIDEPYSINHDKELVPVHLRGEDDHRNRLMLSAGWSVIRFAEQQIALFPEKCCASIIAFIEGSNLELKSVNCWTKDEALNMIKTNYRNTYLPVDFTGMVKINQGLTFRSFKISTIGFHDAKEGKRFYVVNFHQPKNVEIEFIITKAWIEESTFLEIVQRTSLWKEFNHRLAPLDEIHDKLIRALGGCRIQGLGSANSPYFNFANFTAISIAEDEAMENYKKFFRDIFKEIDGDESE